MPKKRNKRTKPKAGPHRFGVTAATVMKNVRADIVAMAASVRKRIYHNPGGLSSATVLAHIGPTASTLLATFLTDADTLATEMAPHSGSGQ